MNADKEMQEAKQDAKDKGLEGKKVAYIPKPGRAWNPLVNFPRNAPCFCESGKKFKKCCIHTTTRTLSAEEAKKMAKLVKQVQEAHKGCR